MFTETTGGNARGASFPHLEELTGQQRLRLCILIPSVHSSCARILTTARWYLDKGSMSYRCRYYNDPQADTYLIRCVCVPPASSGVAFVLR